MYFIRAKDDEGTCSGNMLPWKGANKQLEAVRRAKPRSDRHHQQTICLSCQINSNATWHDL